MARNTYKEDEEVIETLDWKDLKRVGAYLKPYMPKILRVVAVVFTMTLVAQFNPVASRLLIDEVIGKKSWSMLWILAGVFAAVIIIYELCLRYRTIHIM